MSLVLFVLAASALPPGLSQQPALQSPQLEVSDAEAAEILRFANEFIDAQGSTQHAAEIGKRCEQMFDSGDWRKAMQQAQATYGLRTVEYKALLHDCSIYIMGMKKAENAAPGDATPNR